MPPNFQILLINSFAISAKSYVYIGGEVHFKRQCHSSRVAACIEATVKGEPAELLHMYFAMELPHQHELQANLLARAQSLEMATVVARQFQRFLRRNLVGTLRIAGTRWVDRRRAPTGGSRISSLAARARCRLMFLRFQSPWQSIMRAVQRVPSPILGIF